MLTVLRSLIYVYLCRYATYGPEYVYPQVIGISKCNVVKKLGQVMLVS